MSYGRGGSEWRREESYSRGDYGDRRGGYGSRHGHGGARGLARIYGTEQDRHNCTFYIKMGVCRHGDKCDRAHNKPAFSQTVMIPGMYPNPLAAKVAERKDGSLIPKRASSAERDPNFEEFYVDMFEEVSKAGEVDDIVVCDNLCDHMMGNVYIKFFDEEDADKCLKLVSGRYYQGKRLDAEFVPVTDFSLSRCRQYDRRECDRGGACSYMHVKPLDRRLKDDLFEDQPYKGQRSAELRRRRSSSRSPSPAYRSRRRGRSRSRSYERDSRSYGGRSSVRSRSPPPRERRHGGHDRR